MNSILKKFGAVIALAALMIAAVMGIRSGAQSTNLASNTNPTNVMAPYVQAVNEAIISGTAATNLTDVEWRNLMNESIKTDLAAQLWFRQAMVGMMSSHGAKMSGEIRVLESLRAGRTNDAIRQLEGSVNDDIMFLATFLEASDRTKTFKPTRQPGEALKDARDYRRKYPFKSGDAAADERLKEALSYVDKK